jgi:hypothetical protein
MEREKILDDLLFYADAVNAPEVKKNIMASKAYTLKSDNLFRLYTMISLLHKTYEKEIDITLSLKDNMTNETIELINYSPAI